MNRFEEAAKRLLAACEARGVMLATAESCTGGLIAAALTDVAGSSSVVDRGFVTYSNDAKMEMLGVRPDTLKRFGAVSEQTALEMAAGALDRSHARLALSVTGVAGPGGGTDDKPVGLVWFGVAVSGRLPRAEKRLFDDRGRDFVRSESVLAALELGAAALESRSP